MRVVGAAQFLTQLDLRNWGLILPSHTGHSPYYSDGEVHNQLQKIAIRESNNSKGEDEGER